MSTSMDVALHLSIEVGGNVLLMVDIVAGIAPSSIRRHVVYCSACEKVIHPASYVIKASFSRICLPWTGAPSETCMAPVIKRWSDKFEKYASKYICSGGVSHCASFMPFWCFRNHSML